MQGNVVKVWMSPETGSKSRYGLRMFGGILGIMGLVLLLIGGGTVLMMSRGWPREPVSVAMCFGGTALAVWLAVRLGRRSAQDAMIFFQMEGDRLFVVDARRLVDHGRTILDYAGAAAEVQQFLRRLAKQPYLPAGADEIRNVESLKENRNSYALICRIRHPNGRMVRRTYCLIKGYEDEELLLRQLERRKSWENALEPAEHRRPFYILLSALFCGGFVVLCVLSHPAVAKLSQNLYFPCLGAAFLSLGCLVYFAIRQHRGE